MSQRTDHRQDRASGPRTPEPGRRRVLMVCSTGGHLAQLLRLAPWYDDHDVAWVTFRKSDSVSLLDGQRVTWAYHPTTRNVPNLVRNLWLAWKVLRRWRPDLVVSSGAGVAVPFFALAKLMRIPSAYIEVYDRIDSPTMTGRLCYPLADVFLLQWVAQQRLYPRGRVIGPLL